MAEEETYVETSVPDYEMSDETLQQMQEAGFNDVEIDRVKVMFGYLDEDNSGSINEDELRKLLQLTGCDVSENSVKKLLEASDSDGDGTLSFEEYCKMLLKKRKDRNAREQKLQAAFETFDADGSGYLERGELKNVLTSMGMDPIGEDEIDELLNTADLDGDGKLSIKEFVRVLTMEMDEMMQQNEE